MANPARKETACRYLGSTRRKFCKLCCFLDEPTRKAMTKEGGVNTKARKVTLFEKKNKFQMGFLILDEERLCNRHIKGKCADHKSET